MATTQLVRWEPGSLMERLEREFEDFVRMPLAPWRWAWEFDFDELLGGSMDVELYEGDDDYVVRAALPGVPEDRVHIELEGDLLTIRVDEEHEEERRDGRAAVQRRFRAAVRIPGPVDADKARAHLERGVLEVTLPKTEASRRKVIRITPSGVERVERSGRRWRLPLFRRRLLERRAG